jgi:hypothetical protein
LLNIGSPPCPPSALLPITALLFSVDRFVAESALLSFLNRQRHVAPLHLSFLHLLIAICSDDGKVQLLAVPTSRPHFIPPCSLENGQIFVRQLL